MTDTNVEELLVRITEQQAELIKELKAQKRNGKDGWDRLTAVAPIVSAAIMACIGAYFTFSFNQQQLRVQEIQTVEKFIPHLIGDEKQKRAAILAINSMGHSALAAKVASIFASEGTASALKSIAENSADADQKMVREALNKTLDVLAAKYKSEGRDQAALDEFKSTSTAATSAVPEHAVEITEVRTDRLERPVVESVHLKQPEPRTETNNSVEADEAENQHARPAISEAVHTKQQ
jgi:hypothetical protein